MKHPVLLLCLLGLTACASPYGNYANIAGAPNAQMADDAASELTQLYPPASTWLYISQDNHDAYGAELVKKLREDGYALDQGKGLATMPVQHTEIATAHGRHKPAVAKRSLAYIVDQVGAGLYRATLHIDGTLLSRVYEVSENSAEPAGAWTRKE